MSDTTATWRRIGYHVSTILSIALLIMAMFLPWQTATCAVGLAIYGKLLANDFEKEWR